MNWTSIGIFLILGALLVFLLYRRARSFIGRQQVRRNALAVRLVVFAVLGTVILLGTLGTPSVLLGDLVGLVAGAVVSGVGIRLTTFESTPEGLYYTPNKYIGLSVFILFALRLLYKVTMELTTRRAEAGQAPLGPGLLTSFSGDLLTTTVYFLLIGYYVFYYGLLLLRYRQTAALS